MPRVQSISAQFAWGTYTWPISRDEVCSMSRRGQYPSWMACLVRENTPEMRACDAMMAAAAASATRGRVAQAGARRKNGLAAALASLSSNAP